MKETIRRAQNYRARAEELRTIRESWSDEATKEILSKIATDYDSMAEHLERKLPHAQADLPFRS